ncbi:MAG TPA: helix-turn-helix domain-containing protein [Rhizomicrobium sp.]|nr:helix-turn-helix domain-containing protein [Rhizomicrobium sp.]
MSAAGLSTPTRTATPPIAARMLEARPSLSSLGTVVHFRRNATIFSEGGAADHAYKIVSGAVRLSKMMSDGRRQIAEFALPGDFIGINWLDEHAMTAEALNDATLVAYGRGRLERLGDENREVRAELFANLRHDLWAAQNHLVILGRQSALERVAGFLLQLLARSESEDGNRIGIPMTRQDIADYLGLTIETVCRMLTKLKTSGSIGIPDRHTITVRNTAALKRAAQPEE